MTSGNLHQKRRSLLSRERLLLFSSEGSKKEVTPGSDGDTAEEHVGSVAEPTRYRQSPYGRSPNRRCSGGYKCADQQNMVGPATDPTAALRRAPVLKGKPCRRGSL